MRCRRMHCKLDSIVINYYHRNVQPSLIIDYDFECDPFEGRSGNSSASGRSTAGRSVCNVRTTLGSLQNVSHGWQQSTWCATWYRWASSVDVCVRVVFVCDIVLQNMKWNGTQMTVESCAKPIMNIQCYTLNTQLQIDVYSIILAYVHRCRSLFVWFMVCMRMRRCLLICNTQRRVSFGWTGVRIWHCFPSLSDCMAQSPLNSRSHSLAGQPNRFDDFGHIHRTHKVN